MPGQGTAAGGRRLAESLRGHNVAVIGEIKKKSPAKGVLNQTLDPSVQAKAFERGGVAAISVLTEPTYFDGSIDDLRAVRSAVRVPVLKKDFHVDPLQLIEAKNANA